MLRIGMKYLFQQIGNGVLVTKLFIHRASLEAFREYQLVAENSVSMTRRNVEPSSHPLWSARL